MSETNAISSNQPSLIDEIMNAPNTLSNPCIDCIHSSTSTEELSDKLNILEKSVNNDSTVLNSIKDIQKLIEDGNSLKSIQSLYSNT